MKLNFRRGSAFASKKAREYLKDKKPREIQNITVIRHAAIGDFMNIRPFLIELRKFFPNAKITLSVVKHYMYGIPEDLIDALHVMSRYKEDGSKTDIFTRIKEAKKLPPQDIIFDLTDSTITLLLVFLTKAKLKIGYPYRMLRRSFFDLAVLRSEFVLEAEAVFHMINILGVKTPYPLIYGLKENYTKVAQEKKIIYFAGASIQEKCWEAEKFTKLINAMSLVYDDYNHIILQGIGKDEEFFNIYNPLQNRSNVFLQQKLSLEKVMQLLRNSRCLVSNDTGVRNIAIALEVPTIGIFFNTAPFRYCPREEIHDFVFNSEYRSPTVDDVLVTTKKLVNKLYEK